MTDPHCTRCAHGQPRRIPDDMGRMLFCVIANLRCENERSALGKCGPSAKHYQPKQPERA